MQTEVWEADWLAYARRLLSDEAHRARCDATLGPEAVARADAGDLRWPGYLGPSYRPGGVLMAATVHREFHSGRPPLPLELKDELVSATRGWRDGQLDDKSWLASVRAVYKAGLERHWAVGRLVRALQRRTGLHVEDIAYVNAARCQVVEGPPTLERLAAIKSALVPLCAAAYPLTDLADVLQPAALIVTKGTFDIAGARLDIGVPLFVVDQRQLCLRAPHRAEGGVVLPSGALVDVWAPRLAALLAAAN